jgi:hypothetical protein
VVYIENSRTLSLKRKKKGKEERKKETREGKVEELKQY